MPQPATRRGPKRSASTPAGAPNTNQTKAATENTSATCAREAPNSDCKAVKKAAKEYAAPKPTNIRVKAAATTTQPCEGRFNVRRIDAAFSSVTIYREVPGCALQFRPRIVPLLCGRRMAESWLLGK